MHLQFQTDNNEYRVIYIQDNVAELCRINTSKLVLTYLALLFAVAGNLSIKYGYDGFVYGEPMDQKLMEHYEAVFNAERVPRRAIKSIRKKVDDYVVKKRHISSAKIRN